MSKYTKAIPSFSPIVGSWEIDTQGNLSIKYRGFSYLIHDDKEAYVYEDLLRAWSDHTGYSCFTKPEPPTKVEKDDLQTIIDHVRTSLSYRIRMIARMLLPKADPVFIEAPNRDEMKRLYDGLGLNGQRVAIELLRRLQKGQDEYGDFPARKWTKESREEQLDNAVYCTVDTLTEEARLNAK